MIENIDKIKIGYIKKTFGVKGQFIAVIDPNFFDSIFEVDYSFFKIDGLLIPFKIEEVDEISDVEVNLKVEFIENVEEANKYKGVDIYIEKSLSDSSILEDDDTLTFENFSILNSENYPFLTIDSVENYSGNIVFVCKDNSNVEVLLPANDDLFEYIDEKNRIIKYKNINDILI